MHNECTYEFKTCGSYTLINNNMNLSSINNCSTFKLYNIVIYFLVDNRIVSFKLNHLNNSIHPL